MRSLVNISLVMLLLLLTQCQKQTLKPVDNTVNVDEMSFTIEGEHFIHETLTFNAAVPNNVTQLTWFFGDGHQNETVGTQTQYSYQEIGEYPVTIIANEVSEQYVRKRIVITRGATRMNGDRQYKCSYYKRHKDNPNWKSPTTEENRTFTIDVQTDNAIDLKGNGPFYTNLPATLLASTTNSVSYELNEPGNNIKLDFNTSSKKVSFTISQPSGDSVLEFSAAEL